MVAKLLRNGIARAWLKLSAEGSYEALEVPIIKKIVAAAVIAMVLVGMLVRYVKISFGTIGFTADVDFAKLGYKEITFNVYHSNTKDHHWELLTSFKREPKEGYSYDTMLGDCEGLPKDVVRFRCDSFERDGSSEDDCNNDGEETKDVVIKGYSDATGWDTYCFEINDMFGEHPIRLIEVSTKGDDVYHIGDFEAPSLDEPYEVGGSNIDNILIAVSMY